MNPKNSRKKSPIHENADANITCDFGDGDISRSRSFLSNRCDTYIHTSLVAQARRHDDGTTARRRHDGTTARRHDGTTHSHVDFLLAGYPASLGPSPSPLSPLPPSDYPASNRILAVSSLKITPFPRSVLNIDA